jgi:hypothetical protein
MHSFCHQIRPELLDNARFSPRSGFSGAIRRMSWRSSTGIGGRPGRDLYRHSRHHPRGASGSLFQGAPRPGHRGNQTEDSS